MGSLAEIIMNPIGNHIFVIPKEEKEQALLTTYKPVSQECVVYLVSPDVKDIKTGQNIIVRRGKILKVNNNHILNTEHIQLVNYG